MAAASAAVCWSPQPLLPSLSLDSSLRLAAADCQGRIAVFDFSFRTLLSTLNLHDTAKKPGVQDICWFRSPTHLLAATPSTPGTSPPSACMGSGSRSSRWGTAMMRCLCMSTGWGVALIPWRRQRRRMSRRMRRRSWCSPCSQRGSAKHLLICSTEWVELLSTTRRSPLASAKPRLIPQLSPFIAVLANLYNRSRQIPKSAIGVPPSVGQLREVSNKAHNAELKLFLEVELDQHGVHACIRSRT